MIREPKEVRVIEFLKKHPMASASDAVRKLSSRGITLALVERLITDIRLEAHAKRGNVPLQRLQAAAVFIRICGYIKTAKYAFHAAKSVLDAAKTS